MNERCPPPQITAENLASGEYPELARFDVGKRALIFAARPEGWGLAIVTVALDERGVITRVYGSFYVNDRRLETFRRTVDDACAQLAAYRP